MAAAAEQVGLNLDLTLDGQHYVLVDIYAGGHDENGFMTSSPRPPTPETVPDATSGGAAPHSRSTPPRPPLTRHA
jgi:hypothetical protein